MSTSQERQWRDRRTGHVWKVRLTRSSTPVIGFTRWGEMYVGEVVSLTGEIADVAELRLEELLDEAIKSG